MKGTVVVISSVHWHATWQRHHDISWGLADRDYRVVYLEPLPKRWPGLDEWRRVAGRLSGSPEMAGYCRQELHPSVQIVSPLTVPDVGLGRRVNERIFVPRLVGALRVGTLARPLVVINYLPTPAARMLARHLAPDLIIYDCVQDWANSPRSADLQVSEQEMMGEVDLVFADSPYLIKKMQRLHDKVFPALPAVHLERFADARSQESPTGNRPRCAYFGGVGTAINVDLLRQVSHRYPLRIIGPVRRELAGFSERIEMCGPVPHEQVAGLLRDADVLLLPYDRRSPHNAAVIPAKTFECLATGKPTVVAGLGSLAEFIELFYLATSDTQFFEMIDQAPYEDPALVDRRIACAQANTWERRIEEIIGYIETGLQSAQCR